MAFFHPEEEFQVWALYGYEQQRPGTRYLIEFFDTEGYVCTFDAAYESENGGELDIEDDNPLYDEFAQVAMQVVEERQPGLRRCGASLLLDYRDWPARITDIDRGELCYPPPGSSHRQLAPLE